MPRTMPTRMPERMSADRADLDALLDATVLAHIAMVDDDGHPVVVPTMGARWEDRLVVHGSTGSRWMRRVATGVPVSVSLATIDGLVVARSAFESSLVYRSAVLFGSFSPLEGAEKEHALDAVTERLLPGRTAEVRRSTPRELAATMLLVMPIEQWSVRGSDHMPEDPPEDVGGESWAGQVRYAAPPLVVVPAPDLRAGIAVPASTGAVSGVR